MGGVFETGNKGPKVRGDCHISYEQSTDELEIHLQSKVEKLYGDAITELVENVFRYYEITTGKVEVIDSGALDFAIAARAEACARLVTGSETIYPVPMLEENRYGSERRRMRISRLYLPGNSPRMMINAGVHKPHAVILDLEDAVAFAKKPEARIMVRNSLRQIDFMGAERMVRINQLPLGLEDLDAIIPNNVHLVLVPKCEYGETIKRVNERIDAIRKREGIEAEVFLMPIIESSIGVANCKEIAQAGDNIVAISIGLEDYTADIGVQRTKSGEESFYARSHLVNVCKAHDIQPIDSVFSDVADMEALAENVRVSKQLGFEGMGCIHPRQIPVLHSGFAPDETEITKARKIVLAFDDATARGLGVVSLGSKMIDPPVVERAQQTISKAVTMNILSENWREEHV